jgi:hypothetical protein
MIMNKHMFLGFNKSFILCILIGFNAFSQEKVIIAAQIKNVEGKGIPYVTVLVNYNYGCIADSLGNFKVQIEPKDSVNFTSIGYKERKEFGKDLIKLKEIILENKIIELLPIEVSKNRAIIFSTIEGRVRRMTYKVNYNFEDGTIITNPTYAGKRLKSITFKAGFRGEPIFPLRVNVYNLNKLGLPNENLLQKSLIVSPERKVKWITLDVEEQNIFIPENGICVSVELINNSPTPTKLSGTYTPLIGYDTDDAKRRVIRALYLPKWTAFKSSPWVVAFKLEMY